MKAWPLILCGFLLSLICKRSLYTAFPFEVSISQRLLNEAVNIPMSVSRRTDRRHIDGPLCRLAYPVHNSFSDLSAP